MLEIFGNLADTMVFRWLGLTPETALGEALYLFVKDTTKIFFLLAVIVFVMGPFRTMLSPKRVRDYIEGKSHGIGYLLNAILV